MTSLAKFYLIGIIDGESKSRRTSLMVKVLEMVGNCTQQLLEL
jgi:hypothetical protein